MVGFQNKNPHPYVAKTLNSLKPETTLAKSNNIIYVQGAEPNKYLTNNIKKDDFAENQTNETHTKRREILDDILAPSKTY